MPTIIITAADPSKLPSPILLQSWLDDWSPVRWNDPVTSGSMIAIRVVGLTPQQVEGIIIATIDEYNQTHTEMDAISATISG